jgi:hypothetical protein
VDTVAIAFLLFLVVKQRKLWMPAGRNFCSFDKNGLQVLVSLLRYWRSLRLACRTLFGTAQTAVVMAAFSEANRATSPIPEPRAEPK